ncbi:arginase family protein, partial [Klebsiella pneumoniae]|uniref:arginase family protein n=1 Tax=Klebsiella pneumoniae TaxID=573 RepID=UPI003EDF97DC
LDPAFAPGVSHHEPGGLSVRELLSVLGAQTGRVIGADIVELNPTRDIHAMTATVAAKLAKELIARLA